MKKNFLMLLYLSATIYCSAQHPCGNPTILPEALRYIDPGLTQRTQDGKQLIKVFFHVFANNDGTNAAATGAELQSEFNILVNDYAGSNVCFAFIDWQFVLSTSLNNALYADSAAIVNQVAAANIPGCLNIYYARGILKNPGCTTNCTYGGNSFAIPNSFCAIATGNIGVWRTISHEVGHCLGLIHTFETGAPGPNSLENINGSNCTSAGDFVCDTPADPFGRPCFSNTGCNYTGSCMDMNGNSVYTPPYNNIMSYWGSAGCAINSFTPGQAARASNIAATAPVIQPCIAPNSLLLTGFFPGTLVFSSGIHINAARDVVLAGNFSGGNVSISGSAQVYLASAQIVLSPGFTASPANNSGGYLRIQTVSGCQ